MTTGAQHFVSLALLLTVTLGGSRGEGRGAEKSHQNFRAAQPSTLQRDWYFRETLVAIDDWETILARWESETPEAERTPVFPVPTDGRKVLWPNPIPLPLLPNEDAATRVQLRLVGDTVEVQWTGSCGKSLRNSRVECRVSRAAKNGLGSRVEGLEPEKSGHKFSGPSTLNPRPFWDTTIRVAAAKISGITATIAGSIA